MNGQWLLFAALAAAAIVLAVFLAVTLWQLRNTIRLLESRLSETLRQAEMTAEDLRKTNAALRDILAHVERSAANVAEVTEGGRRLRQALDTAAVGVLHTVFPMLGHAAGAVAGVKAFASTVANRFSRKEESHE